MKNEKLNLIKKVLEDENVKERITEGLINDIANGYAGTVHNCCGTEIKYYEIRNKAESIHEEEMIREEMVEKSLYKTEFEFIGYNDNFDSEYNIKGKKYVFDESYSARDFYDGETFNLEIIPEKENEDYYLVIKKNDEFEKETKWIFEKNKFRETTFLRNVTSF